ncbi:MAG: sialate O-acetylesterase [Candidatus Brocadiaceae bacterium]|nr:sialate O-acetylesterase [Candidatus Brocadiaceae bacterium]
MFPSRRRFAPVLLVSLVLNFLFIAPGVSADVQPHTLFGDNMVLQQRADVPVWGTADPGEAVTVSIAGQTAQTTANPDGSWMLKLKPLEPGGPHQMTIAGKTTVTIDNVLVGEVWVASGQSNMNFELGDAANGPEEVANANYPSIRFFYVNDKSLPEPVKTVRGRWRVCTPADARGFSATAYFFARHLHRQLDVPIGILQSSHGASPAEAWTEARALKACIPEAVERYEEVRNDRILERHERELAAWEEAGGEAGGRPKPQKPKLPRAGTWVHMPSGFWNGAIYPLIPYAIRGTIWYQGESNTDTAEQTAEYHRLLPAMIRSWRQEWGQGDFPFLIVELAPYLRVREEPSDGRYPRVREAQRITAGNVPHTGLISTTDIGDARDPHPKNKQDVGRRLGLLAEAMVYGRDVVYSGPVLESVEIEGNRVRLTFKHVHGGLVTNPPDQPVTGFAVAGEDRRFVWAQAGIDGSDVLVRSDEVTAPVAVRYAWADNPVCNLFNRDGLPAFPFRTDDW